MEDMSRKIMTYKMIVGLVSLAWMGLVLGGGIVVSRWYGQNQLMRQEVVVSDLKRVELEDLEKILKQRTVSLEPKLQIMYGKDIGQEEPFGGR